MISVGSRRKNKVRPFVSESTICVTAEVERLLHVTRMHGARLANAAKNVGKPMFAFNALQRSALPRAYRPPIPVSGKVAS